MTQAMLDLEQYFERDIIEFLDKKLELQNNEAKPSSSEMLLALESNNVAVAAKILEGEIYNYNKLPMSNFYKEQNFKKILEMYRQAKEFIRLNPQECKLKEYIELLEQSKELEQGPVEKIKVFEERLNALEEMKINAKAQQQEFAKKLDEQIKERTDLLVTAIRKRDMTNAMKNYKELKTFFEQYPSAEMEKKQELYNDLISFFMQIKKLRKELEEDNIKILEAKKRLELATKKNAANYLRLADLKELINQIKEDVKISDFNSATQKTIEIREIINKIPDQYKHIRSILSSKVDIIVQRIEFVKRLRNHN